MSQPNYLEILKRLNPSVYIQETNNSTYNITPYFNRINLVVGVSREGMINMPVLCVSPENFEDIFGKQDYSLERKKSYFHRTVKNMLEDSPVICLNLRLHNDTDKYNWINISTTSNFNNGKTRSNNIIDFYNTASGFWKRDKEQLQLLTNTQSTKDYNPLSFVNMKTKKVSLLMFKTNKGNFDYPIEDWYKGNYPDYLHPKSYVSDYMIEVIAIQGDWHNYKQLMIDPIYSNYFSKDGIKKDKVDEFLNLPNITLLKRWVCSLIPYFKDKNGNDLYIESVINDDVNETGILCSYNLDIIETDSYNYLNDIIGKNLIKDRKPSIDFLSYKRYLSSFLVVNETALDVENNAFGNPFFNASGRTQTHSEGYVHNVAMKPIIISTTSSIEVKPFVIGTDSYGIINGKKIIFDDSVNSDIIALHEVLERNYHIPYVVVLTENGVSFRFGTKTLIEHNLYFPSIDYRNEIVLAYYEISQNSYDNYSTILNPVCLDTNGYVNLFNNNIIIENDYLYSQTLLFKNANKYNNQDYIMLRTLHMWYYLSNNLIENVSIVIDNNYNKQTIKYIETGQINDDKYIKIMTDFDVNISSTSGNISYYIKDNEFLSKNDTNYYKYDKPPLSYGTTGLIGEDSFLNESYMKGDINSGDPFFWGLNDEYDVYFKYDNNINQNVIIVNYTTQIELYNVEKIIIEGTEKNNGLFHILNIINYEDKYAIIVKEDVNEEFVKYIQVFDGDNPLVINLYYIDKLPRAIVEKWTGDPEELYLRLQEKNQDAFWAKTLEIEKIYNTNKIGVDWSRYVNKLEKGYFLLSDNETNLCRIIDLYRVSETELIVETDMPIKIRYYENDPQTDIYKPIHDWVTTLDFKVLDGHKLRNEVFPDGTDEKMNEILNLIAPNTKMANALCTDKINWRYLIDSFGGGLIENSKYQLASLAENKKFALSFINVPSIKDFRKDGFKYLTNKSFDTSKLLSGGDRKNNYGSSYSIYNTSRAVYLTPYVSIFENNRFYNIPPASFVAQKYMQKHNNNKLKIWDVVAGLKYGELLNINGIEEKFDSESLKDLSRFGITAITNLNNYRFYINNENTSYLENSLLKYVHVTEILIELEMSMYKMLKTKQWKEIIKENIDDIINSCNIICDYYKNNNAISNYYNIFVENIEYTDNQIGYIQTTIEINSVMMTILLDVNY